LRILGAEGGD